ncbi:MAG: AAA family ATPase [Bacillota bacterium]
MFNCFDSVDNIRKVLLQNSYLVDKKVATTVFLAVKMQKPLLVEGPAGVGKTYLARALAKSAGCPLIRLQCYPGLDESKALYEWNYQKQLLYIQSRHESTSWDKTKTGIYTEEFLLSRPILKAFLSTDPVVLLIDEIDKSDDELESFLLEALSDFQVSIPELGTVKCINVPIVIITSNNSRDFSDALKRRCLHLHMPYPDRDREEAIIRMHLKEFSPILASQIATFLSRIRKMALRKLPGISETIDWARSLVALNISKLDREAVNITLNALLKYEEDILAVDACLDDILTFQDNNFSNDNLTAGSDTGEENKIIIQNEGLSRFDF